MRRALILVPVLLLGGCNMAFGGESHARGSKTFQVGNFDKIALAGSADVEVRTGAALSVRAEGDEKRLERLEVIVENGALQIRQKQGNWGFSWGHHGALKVFVTVPALSGASVSGSGDMRIDKVAGNRFEGSIAGSGDMAVAQMQVAEAAFNIAGSGGVSVNGKSGKTSFSTAGSGDIRAGGLESGTLSVSVMGSGDVQAHAVQSAEVSIAGSGDVQIAGTKNCTIHKAGSGDVRCG